MNKLKLILGLLLSLYSFMLLGGLAVNMGMEMSMHMSDDGMSGDVSTGMTADCPFMADDMSVCPMSGADHLAFWKQSLLATNEKGVIALLLLSFAVFFATFFEFGNAFFVLRLRLRRKWSEAVNDFNRMFRALLDGSLHPRLYDLV